MGDPIEASLRGRMRGFIETMLAEELTAASGGVAIDRVERLRAAGNREGAGASAKPEGRST